MDIRANPIAPFPKVMANPTINRNIASIVSEDEKISVPIFPILKINRAAKSAQPIQMPLRQLRIRSLCTRPMIFPLYFYSLITVKPMIVE